MGREKPTPRRPLTADEIRALEATIVECVERATIVLMGHGGYFASTSEFRRCLGFHTSITSAAIDRMLAQGLMTQGVEPATPTHKACSYFLLTDQTPSPLMRRVTLAAHRASACKNANGKDCHPWPNQMLKCYACAVLRTTQPWMVSTDDPEEESGQYRPTNLPRPNEQIALPVAGRRRR